jgi:hypothetical protein
MNDMNDMDDFPKLIPDRNIRFEDKDRIRRSAEANFECSELEHKIRLIPDMNTVMPDKNSLKHKTFKFRLAWLPLTAAAAALIFAMIVTGRHDKQLDNGVVSAKIDSTGRPPESVPETGQETKSLPEKTAEKSINIPANKSIGTENKTAVKTNDKPQTDEQDLPAETPEIPGDKYGASRTENLQIKQIASIIVPVEMMKKEKTVFVYRPDYRPTVANKAVSSMASVAQKLAADVNEAKQNIEQKLNGFKRPNILSRLSLDRGIDREIDEWAKNNPDVPFTVYIDDFDENKMAEILDENGTLIRAIFFTNRSLKYRNNKVYQASNI